MVKYLFTKNKVKCCYRGFEKRKGTCSVGFSPDIVHFWETIKVT